MTKMWIGVAAVLMAMACGGGHVEPVPPAFQDGLTGLWALNEELSENLPQVAGGGRGGPGGQPGVGPGGGGDRRRAGGGGRSGRGGRGGGGPGRPGDPSQMRAAMSALRPARRINLELSDSTVVLRFDRQTPLSLMLDGSDTEFEVGPESTMKAKAEWKEESLRTRREYDQFSIGERYALVSGTDRMELIVESRVGERSIKIIRIYDRIGN